MREQNSSQFVTRRPVQMGRSQLAGTQTRPVRDVVAKETASSPQPSVFDAKISVPTISQTTVKSVAPKTHFQPRQMPRFSPPRPTGQVRTSDLHKRIDFTQASKTAPVQTVQQKPQMDIRIARKQKEGRKPRFDWLRTMSTPQIAIVAAAVLIFIMGVSVSVLGFKTNNKVQAQAQKYTQQTSVADDENAGDRPSEVDPGPKLLQSYKVAPDMPRRISISKIGVNRIIRPLGVKSNNELKAPANIYEAGWYNGSAKPGQDGAMLIDGHANGPYKPGIFHNLKKLKEGDIIEVERGDGLIYEYQVVKTEVYDRANVDMAAAVTSAVPGKQGLNIITCTGTFQKDDQTFDKRLLVSAVRVD